MPVTQIPPRDPSSPLLAVEHRDLSDAQHWETAYRGFNPDHVPHLLIQLQDDLSRARKREAVWLSVILHLFIVILIWNSEKLVALFPHRVVPLTIRTDVDREKNATFLELPPDEQKVTRRPDAKIISDKDRIASSKAPQINREDLRKILQSTRPGQPGERGQLQQPPGPPQQTAQSQPQPPSPPMEQPSPQPGAGFAAPKTVEQSRIQVPPQGGKPQPSFNNSMTAGSAIEQATQQAAASRGRYGGTVGDAGDGGLSHGRSGANAALAPAEILTDTMGVDFSPYITRMLQVIKQNWILILPPSAYPPISKQGMTSVDFTILKDGRLAGMTLHTSSGDVALDRAAVGGISNSNPLPALPREFPGQYVGIRVNFYLNMEITDLK